MGTDYTVSFSNNVNVGDVATATVNGMGNYTGTATVTFTILPRSLGEASVQSVDSQTWSGSALTPVPVVRFGSRTLVNGQDVYKRQLILFIGGSQMLCLGVFWQYLAKSYVEVKNRPIDVVRESNLD